MKTIVKTNLTLGRKKDYFFGDNNGEPFKIKMHDNPKFEKSYDSIESFLNDFMPTKQSTYLMSRIAEEFNRGGRITFKPVGYQANQTFIFSK